MRERNYKLEYQNLDKEKAKEYHAAWRAKNKDRLRKYAAKNPEANQARYKKWKAENPERMAEHRKKWEAKNMEEYKPRKQELARERYRTRPHVRAAVKTAVKRYGDKNPERIKEWQRASNLRKYGLTTQQWEELFEQQGRRCAVCTSDKSAEGKAFHVDHCHNSDRVRGILCHHCNLMLGNARDNIAILEAAIQYLKEVRA